MSILHFGIRQVLYILRVFGRLACTWPPDPNAQFRELLFRDIAWSFAILNIIGALIPLTLNILRQSDNIVSLMMSLSELTALSEVLCNLILCRIERTRLQRLLRKVEDFIESASERERLILEKCWNRYYGFSIFVALSYFAAAVAFVCGPLFVTGNLPMEAWYPFSTDPPITRFVLYCWQIIGVIQTALGIIVDFMVAILFGYSITRLKILCLELENIKDKLEMKLCIIKHQEIIRYVDETQVAVGYLICKTNITMASAVIFGAFPLVYKQSITITAQFLCMVLGGCQRLYVTAWPADDLYEISRGIALSAYKTRWIEKSSEISKNTLIMIQRAQKPLTIRMGGLLPALSVEYYSNFIKSISSYFMTIRAAIDH